MDGPFAGLMEKIMCKTNHTTKTRELTEDELNQVSGGKTDRGPNVYMEIKLENTVVSGFSLGSN